MLSESTGWHSFTQFVKQDTLAPIYALVSNFGKFLRFIEKTGIRRLGMICAQMISRRMYLR